MIPDDPLLRDIKTVRMLSGMSGARVLLVTRDDRHWFVRKVARDPASSERLRRQMAKQLLFRGLAAEIVSTPAVLDHGEHEGRFFFDMEFIRGMDGVSYLRRATYADVVSFADRFCGYLATVAERPPARPLDLTLFDALYDKLCAVQRKTAAIESETLVQLFIALERLRGLSLQPTLCHGDLTLENIVIDDQRRLWMLDMLDSPFEHYWQDVTKLHQDLEGGWYLMREAPIARCVLDYISRRLMAATVKLDPHYEKIHAVLIACTFVRILPYVRTANEKQFVTQRIEHFARRAQGVP